MQPSAFAETHRAPVSPVAGARPVGFELQPPERTGVFFTNFLALERHLTNYTLLNGSGVACGDVDGDGLADIYFARLDGPNALYRNLGGWKFQEIASSAGVACEGLDATGVCLADLDGDGDLDLIVNSLGGGTHIFFNDGRAHFTPSSQNPLNARMGGASMALADIDGNGTLDLYIANYRTVTLRDQPNTRFTIKTTGSQPQVTAINGRPLTEPDLTNRFTFKFGTRNGTGTMSQEENGEPDLLLLNDGHGKFHPVSFTGGAFLDESGKPLSQPPFDWGLSVMMRDLDGDGFPDIYVCNDFRSPDRIWINDGRGHFRAMASTAIRQTSLFSMGVDVADINRDGIFDIFVCDMLSRSHQRRMTQHDDMGEMPALRDGVAQTGRNTLLLGRGDGTFAEIAQFAGVHASEWSWTPIFLDVDLDGYEDLLICNGFERDAMNFDLEMQIKTEKASRKMTALEQLSLRRRYPRLATPNVAFRNLGAARFSDVSDAWNFNQPGVCQGMALADLDNDGDMDVVINNMNGPAFLLRNESAAARLAVRLHGLAPNTRGIGAKISVSGGPAAQMQEMICGGRYASSDDPMRTFAAGAPTNDLRIEVVWRSGRRTVIDHAAPNSIYEIDETGSVPAPKSDTPPTQPWFADVSAQLDHRHDSEAFDDFARQPLLPRRLSQLGPGIAWCDLDGDGRDDLLIGGGSTRPLAVFHNDGRGAFHRQTFGSSKMESIQTALLGFRDSAGELAVIAGLSTYQEVAPGGVGVQRLGSPGLEIVRDLNWSVGSLAAGDFNADGILDLFVGGRVVPGRYPEPASSLFLTGSAGKLAMDPNLSAALTNAGLVSGAVFSDLDGDGTPELVLACEWGPVRVYKPFGGKAVELTTALGLDKFRGCWNGVTAGDFDEDGRMDLIASNWGKNTKHEWLRAQPLRIYFGDFDGDGVTEVIESYFDPVARRYVPARQLDVLSRGMPWLRRRYPTWETFSHADVEEVLGEFAPSAKMLEVNWFENTVFLNRGDHFEPIPLRGEAQYAPVFGICVADFDNDGHEDIFLAQNFFGATSDASRCDAGRGLLLRGTGAGTFNSVPGQASGIAVYGEQRGAAVCDFDEDGKADLVVTQHGGATKLYRNLAAAPGLRLRLVGPPGNTPAVGATLRLGDGTRWGPAREIHAGSGYWSQDSAVQVMARTGDYLQVRWPGGKMSIIQVPRDAREIAVETSGAVRSWK